MKLLLDQNLSDRIISRISDLFPGSTHVKAVGLTEAKGPGGQPFTYDFNPTSVESS